MASWVLYLDHNTYWGRWWAKAPRSKMVSGSWSLVEPQRCQSLCVTPRQSSGSPPQHRQARQTNLRYFRENKPKKAKENTFQTSRAKFCLYRENQSMSDPLPSPHPHTGAASWNPQDLAARLSWCRPRAHKWAWSSGGTWEAAGTELPPTPNACALAGTDVTLSGERRLYLKGAELQWELRWCQVYCVPLNKPLHFLRLDARKSHCISGLIFLLLRPSKVGYCYILVSNVRIFCNKSDIIFMSNYWDTLHVLYPLGTSFSPSSLITRFLSSPLHTELYK